ncbi:MAG: hypothetical protein JST66_10530 [Bacteroidetes bacterium]|nr:hypothetical protein [Bacteroidota bacterium]
MTLKAVITIALAAAALLARAQQNGAEQEKSQSSAYSAYDRMAPSADAYQGAWNTSEAQRTAELWKALCEQRPADVDAQLNWFRSERNARQSRNNGQLTPADKAALDDIAGRISTTAPGSFEEHLARYYVDFPTDQAFEALRQAAAQEPARTELIVPLLTQATLQGNEHGMDTWSAELEKRGGLARPLMDAASDLLLSVAKGGVLFTNGDMDTQPAVVRQRVHDDRRDVLLVDQRLLADAGYRQRIWKAAKAEGPVPPAGAAFAKALVDATERPVFLALGLDRAWLDAFPGRLHATGAALRICNGTADGISTLEANWAAMKKPMDAGPLSRNYVLPGAVLLEHYRTAGDERRTAQVENELRRIAAATGATQDLLRAGVLQH